MRKLPCKSLRKSLSRFLPALALGLPALVPAVSGPARAEEPAVLAAAAREVVKGFGTTLIGELKAALTAAGPVAAIETCNLRAPAIADQAGAASGWRVGRTALRVRNSKNAPDAWERAGLEAFAAAKAAGADLAAAERFEILDQDGHPVFRYMKAIPTAELCVTCHGAALKPEVEARLKALYPADQATGFAAGDLRGAFTVSRRLD